MSININDIILNTAISKGFTIFTLYPIDYIKTNIQYGNKINYSNYFKFYKGINITLLTQVPYSVIVLTNYTYCKNKMQLNYPQFYNYYKISSLVIIASISDLLGSLWITPVEKIKQFIQVKNIKNTTLIINNIYKKNGFIGFYKGYYSIVLRDLPYRAIKLPTYELLKEYLVKNNYSLNNYNIISISVISALTATFLTNPLDVICTQRLTEKKYNIKNINFFSGLRQSLLYNSLSNAIFFTLFEYLNSL